MTTFARNVSEWIDMIGVIIIVAGAIFSTIHVIFQFFGNTKPHRLYTSFRQNLGRSILLGLEFLVAGDVIRSITGTPSFDAVAILALIVLVRTFLSITFDMEVEGKWPWQKGKQENS